MCHCYFPTKCWACGIWVLTWDQRFTCLETIPKVEAGVQPASATLHSGSTCSKSEHLRVATLPLDTSHHDHAHIVHPASRSEAALVTAAKRHVHEQLGLDLSRCGAWRRLCELHYERPAPSGHALADLQKVPFAIACLHIQCSRRLIRSLLRQ